MQEVLHAGFGLCLNQNLCRLCQQIRISVLANLGSEIRNLCASKSGANLALKSGILFPANQDLCASKSGLFLWSVATLKKRFKIFSEKGRYIYLQIRFASIYDLPFYLNILNHFIEVASRG